MTLEDNAGDVVRKARMMNGVTAEESAAAGRISPEALSEFEQSGVAPAGLDWEGMSSKLQLSASKLRRVAGGWIPAALDAARWSGFRMITTAGDGMTVNAYLAWDPVTREAALFDTGFDAAPIFSIVDSEKLVLRHLFITHSHGDHIAALEPIRARVGDLRIHTHMKGVPAEHRNRPGEIVSVGCLSVSHRETPGHAEDGVTYVIAGFPGGAPQIAVVGDAIFAGSIGGAPGKGPATRQRIREEILSQAGSTLICPGHGPLTTVAEQNAVNPFFE